MFGHAFGGQCYKPRDPPEPLLVEVPCSLKELYNGCAKAVEYRCRKLNLDGRTTSIQALSKQLEIVPGASCGQTITFKGQGN
jgi:hypothetical protein